MYVWVCAVNVVGIEMVVSLQKYEGPDGKSERVTTSRDERERERERERGAIREK
jgi:hypothetical protein